MAVIYLSSVDGSDADNGSTWALAKATLAAALTAAGAGGTVYVDNAHAESTAGAITLASPGTAGSPVLVICASRASGEPPTAVATTGTVTSTANIISYTGHAHVYGLTLSSGSTHDLTSSASLRWGFESCGIVFSASSTGLLIGNASGGANDSLIELLGTSVTFAGTAQSIVMGEASLIWKGGSVLGSTLPTTLFTAGASNRPSGPVRLYGVNLSVLGSGNNLFTTSDSTFRYYYAEACKLGASVTLTTGAVSGPGACHVQLVNCDSGDTHTRFHRQDYQGTTSQETTIIRTGGASDGVDGFSRKMVSTANTKTYNPLIGPDFWFWNEAVGSVTVSVEVVTDNVTLTDKEAWVEVEYMGTSGFPLDVFGSDRASASNTYLGSGTNQTTSSETWTTTGLTTPVKQTLSATITTSERGWVRARVMLAKASTTLYACPKILASSYKQTMLPDGSVMNHVKLPTAAQVTSGVTYGADGTEFTGSASGGGGSGMLYVPNLDGV